MPLDIQPLSTRRQILMVLVMFGLFAGSLGLANILVGRRGPGAAGLSVEFPLPPDVEQLPVNQSASVLEDGTLDGASATWPQGDRYFLAFFLKTDPNVTAPQYIQAILSQVLTETPTRGVRLQPQILAGYAALEADVRVGRRENATFAIIRLATVEQHVVAFCFSGDGVMTDADRQFFDDYCSRQIRVRHERPPRG